MSQKSTYTIVDELACIDASFGTISGEELIPCDLCALQPKETERLFVMQKLFVDRCVEFFICKPCLTKAMKLDTELHINEQLIKDSKEEDCA